MRSSGDQHVPSASLISTRRVLVAALLASSLGASFALGRATRSPVAPPPASAEGAGADATGRRPWSKPRSPLPRLAQLPAAPPAECENTDRRATATSLVETLLKRLPGRRTGGWEEGPEASANAVRPYLQGLADGVKQSSPAVKAAFTDEFTERLCRGSLADDELIAMAYLGQEMPEITGPRAFDCVFSRRGKQEDVVLWYMLDAWRLSGQEKSAAIAQIQRTATDPRTLRRFMSREEEMAMRAGERLARSK